MRESALSLLEVKGVDFLRIPHRADVCDALFCPLVCHDAVDLLTPPHESILARRLHAEEVQVVEGLLDQAGTSTTKSRHRQHAVFEARVEVRRKRNVAATGSKRVEGKLEDVLPRQEPAVAERARRVYSTVSPELELMTPRPLPRKVQDIQTDLGVLEDRVLRKLNRTVAQFAHEPASGQLPEEQRRNRCQPFLQRDPRLQLCLHQ